MAYQHCTVCNLDVDEDSGIHNNSDEHRFNFRLFEWNKYRKALVKDRHGVKVIISPKQINGFKFDYVDDTKKGKHILKITPEALLHHRNVLQFECIIKNDRNSNSVILTASELLHPYELWKRIDKNLDNEKFIEMRAGSTYSDLRVQFSMDNIVVGSYKIPISFNFQTVGKNADTFTIARALVVSVEEQYPVDEEQLTSPFTNNEWDSSIKVYPPTKKMNNLNSYPVPEQLAILLKMGLQDNGHLNNSLYQLLQTQLYKLRPGYPTKNNYRDFWHLLLWMEEVAQALMLKKYNMENVTKKLIGGGRLEIVIPGLAEKRPSVIVGDMIDVMIQGDHCAYKGVIKKVNDKTVEVESLHEDLLNYIEDTPGIELNVRFTLNRLAYERQHQAVDQVANTDVVSSLFPDYSLSRKNYGRLDVNNRFFNSAIANNKEQKTAVNNIVNGTSGSAPYIVFGPPGTGKTVTIVEAMLQIKEKTQKNILVCAPANAACDMLTEKLMARCSRKELIRVISQSVDIQNINPHIIKYTNVVDGEYLQIIPEELRKYRIVVTTLILVGRYIRKYHPDVVFIDEAAQPCEPEALCALAMIEKNKQIVLAGDPNQLGPSTASNRAAKYGLGTSLLERLMELELYQMGGPNFITMLKLNFRSHRTILAIPNELFYGNQLQAVSTESNNDPLARIFVFERIQGLYGKPYGKVHIRGQPIEFCSVMSQERREGRSPSYFNVREMEMVVKYVQALTALRFSEARDNVKQDQIGIVTPYIRQVYKIREELRKRRLENVEVGTTETFQGREKRVIIISTVRAKHDLLAYDKKYNLGFVRHEKRFNVALTRAKSKLVVIGCAHVLATDKNWLQYITYCEELGAFCGAPFAKRTEEVKRYVTNKLSHVKLVDSQHNH